MGICRFLFRCRSLPGGWKPPVIEMQPLSGLRWRFASITNYSLLITNSLTFPLTRLLFQKSHFFFVKLEKLTGHEFVLKTKTIRILFGKKSGTFLARRVTRRDYRSLSAADLAKPISSLWPAEPTNCPSWFETGWTVERKIGKKTKKIQKNGCKNSIICYYI